jgi:hypothetical protein
LEKWQFLGKAGKKYKISPEYLPVLESKEVLRKQKIRICQKDKGTNLKQPPRARAGPT